MKNSKAKYIEYMKKIGVKKPRFTSSEERMLKLKFGENCFDRIDRINNTNSKKEMEMYYKEKNHEIEYSLAMTNIFIHDFLIRTMIFCENNPNLFGDKILDIGCDNGILTCFYAFLFPNSKVYGIDCIEESITCAKSLSQKLSLDNVFFQHSDIHNFDAHEFNTAISTAFVHEATDIPYNTSHFENIETLSINTIANKISSILLNDGYYISIERFPDPNLTLKWVESTNSENLYIDFSLSGKFEWNTPEGKETFPIFVFKKQNEMMKIDYSQIYTCFNININDIFDNS